MIRYKYAFGEKKVSSAEEFAEATAAELKVLLSLMDLSGDCSDEELCELSGQGRSRVAAAAPYTDCGLRK